MIESFIEYMWYLLTTPLKKLKRTLNKWYILCRVFGRRFDEAKEDILRARDEGMVATCSHEMLPVHGADRRLTRYEGEGLENFRSRIAMHEEICKLGGTNEGVLLAVRTLGYASPVLVRADKLQEFNGTQMSGDDISEDRWAEFYIIIMMNVWEEHPISFGILRKNVRMWKEVGAKDNYLFKYNLSIRGMGNVNLTRIMYRKYLHFLEHSGTGRIYVLRQRYRFSIGHAMEYTLLWHEEHNLIFLDGTQRLDGFRKLDAWQKTEVL